MVADSDNFDISPGTKSWVGQSVPRLEDEALLAGRGRYLDDLGVRPGTLQAAILRSPHAHAEIEAIDCAAARAADGVVAVLTGADVKALTIEPGRRRQSCDRVLAHRCRSGALRRRAGRRCGRVRPLSRRGCPRSHRGPLSPIASGGGSARRRSARGSTPPSGGKEQRHRRADFSLRRSRKRLCGRRAPHPRRHPLSAQLMHADRDVRNRRRI